MKSIRIIALVTLLALSVTLSYSQVAVLAYMKVEQGMNGEYYELEKQWMKIHQARKEAGLILNWSVNQKQFSASGDEYNYVVVTSYENMAQMDKEAEGIYEKAYPEWQDSDWDKFFEKTSKSRTMVRQEIYHMETRTETETEQQGKYMVINQMKVPSGTNWNYVSLERDIYKPLHEESVKRGNRVAWSVWSKYPGNLMNFQFVTVDVYSSFAQMGGAPGDDLWKAVHGDKDQAEWGEKTNKARIMRKSEIWSPIEGLSLN